ncbi:DNA repair protein XRCC2 [Drosophila eugracilis]|uniref:DNA repair protein XRCC2 n=1 Tax=Drosophila eugracilis TaxID=29029 RepID=UPI0007E5E033|nr:DNA repair protein XRCC2 [Drosophila eugracilis]XP_017074279.1 DNA repair protein XRCC2 [Drosophila eugracilis]
MAPSPLHSAVFGTGGIDLDSLVEISGPGDSGKSLVLQHLLAHCLAPYDFGGRQWGVILINLSHKIKRESLIKIIKLELKAYSVAEGTSESQTEEQLAKIAEECLGRVQFLNCFSHDDVSVALVDARYAILNDPGLQLIAVDTLSEFYWLDMYKKPELVSMFQHYQHCLMRLGKTCKEAVVCGMYTVDSNSLEDRNGEELPDLKISHHVRMRKDEGVISMNGLPLAFSNGAHVDSRT